MKALKLKPKDKHVLINIGFVCMKQKKFKESEKYLLKGRKLYPKEGNFCYNLATLYANWGDVKSCLEHLEQAVELGASFLDGIDCDPELDPVRKNKEFQILVKKY